MSFAITWVVLAALWVALSGYFDVVHLVFGAVSVTFVSLLSHRHLTGGGELGVGLRRLLRLALYLPWLLWQVLLANVDVLLRVVGVREIDPCIVRLEPDLETEFGKVALANSITLTPGTVTVEIEGGTFVVHALSAAAADALATGVMQTRIRTVEGED